MKDANRFPIRLTVAGVVGTLLLGGCGLAETTAVAATEAEAAAEQIKEGKKLEEKVQRDIEAAQQAAADGRKQMEADSE